MLSDHHTMEQRRGDSFNINSTKPAVSFHSLVLVLDIEMLTKYYGLSHFSIQVGVEKFVSNVHY